MASPASTNPARHNRREALHRIGLATATGLIGACGRSPQEWFAERYVDRQNAPPVDILAMRRRYWGRKYPAHAPVPEDIRSIAEVREERVLDQPVYTLRPQSALSGWHLVYCHGGAFVHPLEVAHWNIVRTLMLTTHAAMTVPVYPLAPEHTHEKAFTFLEQVYRNLLTSSAPQRLVLVGDSAGANLALTQVLRYRDHRLPLPGHVILFSPWLDLTLANPIARTIEGKDVLLQVDPLREAGKWWAGSVDPRSPTLSPLYANLRGLPPLQLYQGTYDILLPDVRTLRDRARAAGVSVDYQETPCAGHVFMGATGTPEAKRVYGQIARTLGITA